MTILLDCHFFQEFGPSCGSVAFTEGRGARVDPFHIAVERTEETLVRQSLLVSTVARGEFFLWKVIGPTRRSHDETLVRQLQSLERGGVPYCSLTRRDGGRAVATTEIDWPATWMK